MGEIPEVFEGIADRDYKCDACPAVICVGAMMRKVHSKAILGVRLQAVVKRYHLPDCPEQPKRERKGGRKLRSRLTGVVDMDAA